MSKQFIVEQGAYEIAKKQIRKLSEEELRLLNQKIIERLNLMQSVKQLGMLAKFSVNDKVSFDYHNEIISGRIVRLNQKTVSLIDDAGTYWKVAPGFLRKII